MASNAATAAVGLVRGVTGLALQSANWAAANWALVLDSARKIRVAEQIPGRLVTLVRARYMSQAERGFCSSDKHIL